MAASEDLKIILEDCRKVHAKEKSKIVAAAVAYTGLIEAGKGWHTKARNPTRFGERKLSAGCFYFVLAISPLVG